MTLRPSSAGARRRRPDPLDHARRQMIDQVDDPRDVEPFQQLGELRADALQRLDLGKQRIEDVGPHACGVLAPRATLAMPQQTALHRGHASRRGIESACSWRAHHRGTREADMMIGGFFDAHHASWGADERALFSELLEEQDVDIMAWAIGTPSRRSASRSDDRRPEASRLHPGRTMTRHASARPPRLRAADPGRRARRASCRARRRPRPGRARLVQERPGGRHRLRRDGDARAGRHGAVVRARGRGPDPARLGLPALRPRLPCAAGDGGAAGDA